MRSYTVLHLRFLFFILLRIVKSNRAATSLEDVFQTLWTRYRRCVCLGRLMKDLCFLYLWSFHNIVSTLNRYNHTNIYHILNIDLLLFEILLFFWQQMVVQSGDYYNINLEVKDKTEELVKISEDKKVFQSKLNKLCKVCQIRIHVSINYFICFRKIADQRVIYFLSD